MLQPRHTPRLRPQPDRKAAYDGVQHGHAGHMDLAAPLAQHFAQVRIHQRKQHGAGIKDNILDRTLKLLLRAYKGGEMFDGVRTLKLRQNRAGKAV